MESKLKNEIVVASKVKEQPEKIDDTRFFVSEEKGTFLVYDRHTGNLHYCSCKNAVQELIEKVKDIPENPTVFTASGEDDFKLNMSTICNLHCDYCFRDKESHISTDVEKAKKIIDYIINVYAPEREYYTFSLNMTSESMFELDKLKKIKEYLDEKLSMKFKVQEFDSIEHAERILKIIKGDEAFISDENAERNSKEKSIEAIVEQLNECLRSKKMMARFPIPEGMNLPDWEKEQLVKMDSLSEDERMLANRRILEILFPETFFHKPNYSMYVCTNGTLYSKEISDFLKSINISTLCVSLDGPASVHDKHRYFYNGNPTHKIIIKNMQQFMEDGFKINVAAVLTKDYPRPLELALYFKSLGVSQIGLNVVRAGASSSFSTDDMEELLKGYDALFEKIYEDAVNKDYSLIDLIKDDTCFYGVKLCLSKGRIVKRCKWNENMVFDCNGNIYPCDYFIGKTAYLRGSILSPKIKDIGKGRIFVDERDSCRDCWAKYMCGGTCFHNSLVNAGDIGATDPVECKYSLALRKKGIQLIHKLLNSGVNVFEFGRYIGIDYSPDLSFTDIFKVKNGFCYSFKGTLSKFELECRNMQSLLNSSGFSCVDEIYVTVNDVAHVGKSQLMDVSVMMEVEKSTLKVENSADNDLKHVEEADAVELEDAVFFEEIERFASRNGFNTVHDFDFGHCVSHTVVSKDEEIKKSADKIYAELSRFRMYPKSKIVYKAKLDAFLGYKRSEMKVFVQLEENVI